MMNAVERLEAVEEIRRLKARYFRCLDTKDWASIGEIFAPDATFDVSEAFGEPRRLETILRSRQAILSYLSSPESRLSRTVHHGHTAEIDILTATTATGIWAMDDLTEWTHSGTGEVRGFHGYGHYHDTYSRIGARWMVTESRISRLRFDRR